MKRFRRARWTSLVLLLASGLLAAREARAQEIPSILWSRHDSTKAAWVSSERAVNEAGQIDWSLFGDLQSFSLRRRVESHKGQDCVSMGSLLKHPMDSRTANSFQELSQRSLAIFRGTVVASGTGFADGDPATLLAVRVDDTIKASPELAVEDTLYVAYPVAELSVKGLRICKSDERFKAVPRVGDTVLVFPLSGPLNEGRDMVYPYSQEILVQPSGGALAIPGRWAADPQLKKASGLNEVEAVARRQQEPRVEKPRKEGR